ncbi:MAG: hypothetical protein WD490_09405 [Opitutales bacterium]
MKLKKVFIFLSLLSLPFLFSACATAEYGGTKHTKVLGGLYEYKEASYQNVPALTIPIRRADFDPGAPYSGNNASFIWGAFTYYDY